MPERMSEEMVASSEQERAQRLALLQLELKEQLKERFARNLKALGATHPEISSRYAHYQPRRAMQFFCLENGVPNLEFTKTGEIFYACENPEQFCQNQVEELLKTQPLKHTMVAGIGDLYGQLHLRYVNQMIRFYNSRKFSAVMPLEAGVVLNCVMLGCGLGYQLAALYSRIEVLNLILIEPDEDLFYASLQAFDWAGLLAFLKENDSRLQFFIGLKPEELFLPMNDLYDAQGRYLSGCAWSYVHYASPEIKRTAEALLAHNYQHAAMLGYFDDHLFATSHGVQALLRHSRFVRKDRELPEAYRQLPFFIVANGPSLDQDIAFLRRYQDKAVILACGTAFETLYHAGVQPDFYGCTERTYHVAQTLGIIPDQSFVKRTIIVGGEVIHPETLSYFPQQALFIKPEEPLFTLLARHFPQLENIRPLLMSNPLVGNLGLAVAVALGFKRVYLFGLDNGRKLDSKKMHSDYNKFYKQSGGIDQAGTYAVDDVVPANFGGECVSGKYFKLSLGSLDYLVNYVKDSCQVFNCSDGAKIAGTYPVHSDALRAEFEERAPVDKEALHSFIHDKLTDTFPFDEDKFRALLDVPLFREAVDKLIVMFTPPVTSRLEYARRMRQAIDYLYALDRKGKRFVSEHLRGSIDNMFIIMAGIICGCKDESTCVKELNLLSHLIPYFLTDIKPLYEKQPDYVLGEHHKYFAQLLGNNYPHSKAPALPRKLDFITKEYQDEQKVFVKRYE